MQKTVVADTDNGTLPFARNVITLEAVPPGHAPNKMNPDTNFWREIENKGYQETC